MKSIAAAWIVGCVAALVSSLALAQTAFPTRTVRLIVPFPGGGINDVLARTVLRLMEEAAPAGGKLRIKQRELAQMIQASRETVNKHLREWTRRKWIKLCARR